MPIPRVIHFIWAGGEKPFPNHEVLEGWQKANPDCQIILWIDKETTPPEVFIDYVKTHKYQPIVDKQELQTVIKKQTASQDDTFKPILFADVTEAGVMAPPVRYEINRFRRNYGCSSDLLRYKILAQYGGAYFDSDIDPGKTALSTAYNFDSEEPQLYITHNTQNSSGRIGNDAFVCSPNHPAMQGLAMQVEKNYEKTSLNDPTIYDGLDMPYPGFLLLSQRGMDTLERTGPTAVKNFLHSIESSTYKALSTEVFNSHSFNDRNWVDVPIKLCKDFKEALKVAKESMQFEMDTMKMGRFAEHVKDISLSLQEPLLLQVIAMAKEGLANFLPKSQGLGKTAVTEIKKMLEAFLEKDLGIIRPKTKEGIHNDLYKRLDDNFLEIHAIASRGGIDKIGVEKIFEKCIKVVSNELVRRGHSDLLFKALKLDKMSVSASVAEEANKVFKKFSELGINFKKKDKFTIRKLIEKLNVLQPAPTGKLSAIEAHIANALLIALSQTAKQTPNIKTANFAKQDQRYEMPVKLWAVTLPVEKGFEDNIKQIELHVKQAQDKLKRSEKWGNVTKDLNVQVIQEAVKKAQDTAKNAHEFYQDTLSWWSKQEESPEVIGELKARLSEMQALTLEAKAYDMEIKLAISAKRDKPTIKQDIGKILDSAKEHREMAKEIRASLKDQEPSDKMENTFK